MNNLRCLAYKPGHEIRKLRQSPANNRAAACRASQRLQGEADAASGGEGRGTHPSSAIIELAGGCKAKDINASNTGKFLEQRASRRLIALQEMIQFHAIRVIVGLDSRLEHIVLHKLLHC